MVLSFTMDRQDYRFKKSLIVPRGSVMENGRSVNYMPDVVAGALVLAASYTLHLLILLCSFKRFGDSRKSRNGVCKKYLKRNISQLQVNY